MQSSAYLGDLGGLTAHRSLVRLDPRGTGESAAPADPASYRCDRQVDDVEALRAHLGQDRVDLLGHSAGGTLAVLYAARHPDRVGRLALVTPSPRPVGLEISDADRRTVAELRRDEPWFPDAFAAFERIWSGAVTEADWEAITPFTHGRWDAATEALLAREAGEKNAEAAAVYYSEGALDPARTTAALARLDAPVLVVAGEYDVGLPPSAPPRTPACSARARRPCCPAAATTPGATTRRGSSAPSRGSCADLPVARRRGHRRSSIDLNS